MEILVTGGCGFVGRHFIKKFVNDNKITCIDNLVSESSLKPLEHENLAFIRNDCRYYFLNSNKHFNLVIHLAAIVGGRNTIENEPIMVADDLAIDAEMFKWAVKTKPDKIIYFSSSAAYPVKYQQSEDYKQLDESLLSFDKDIGMADLTYGWAKLTGEYLARIAHEKYNLNIVCYRPFSGYGEDQHESYPFPAILSRIVNKENPINIWSNAVRDFIYIDDVVDCVCSTYQKVNDGSAINIGSGIPTSFKELVEKMCKITNHEATINIMENKPQGVYYRVSNPKLMNDLNFNIKIPLEEGIKKCLSYKIAIYNSFNFHYELIGYIIDYCNEHGKKAVIYCNVDNSNGYVDFYKFRFNNLEFRPVENFYNEHHLYNKILLITDDDKNYIKYADELKHKTISLDAWYQLRNNCYINRITNRPFNDLTRDWTLPVYKINICKSIHDDMNIFIFSHSNSYNENILNKLTSNKKITIHLVARSITKNSLKNIKHNIILYPNLNFVGVLELLKIIDFGITDICRDKNQELFCLSGMIPLVISTLTPLIINRKTNKYFNIKSAIEYDDEDNNFINLDDYVFDQQKLMDDRKHFIVQNYNVLSKYI